MFKFWNRTVRVNEIGGKWYVEVKVKAYGFERNNEKPVIDTVDVKTFETQDEAEVFLQEVIQ